MTTTNDGWRDLGEDEMIQPGDRTQVNERELAWTEVFASIGMTVRDSREALNWPAKRYQRLTAKSDAATIKDMSGPVVTPTPEFHPVVATQEASATWIEAAGHYSARERNAVVEWLRFLERTDPYLARLRVVNCSGNWDCDWH